MAPHLHTRLLLTPLVTWYPTYIILDVHGVSCVVTASIILGMYGISGVVTASIILGEYGISGVVPAAQYWEWGPSQWHSVSIKINAS